MSTTVEQSVKERPILFSAPMVRALLEGRKTQTRRIVEGITQEQIDQLAKWFHTDDASALAYAMLWDAINGKGSWHVNPWVWVVSFKVLP